MQALLLALVIACTTSPPSSDPKSTHGTFPKVEMTSSGAAPVMQLYLEPWRTKASYDLYDHNLPPGLDVSKRIPIRPSSRRVNISPLPFALNGDARKTIGQDLTIYADGKPLRYASLGGGANSWRLVKDRLEIKARGAQKLELEYSRAGSLTDRYQLSKSGLEPAEFVAKERTYNGDSRPGLLLTSPSKVAWAVDLPVGASFKAFPCLAQPPVVGESDGLDLVLKITEAGSTTEAGRVTLTPEMQPWNISLSKWAGKHVDLELVTEVTGTPDYDYAFVGTPTIRGTAKGNPRRVLVVGFDTTRPDHLGWYGYDQNTTPELDAIANTSGVFDHAWTPAPRTRPSFRSATTGRYPLDAVGATNIGEVFQRNGFATAGFVANIHLQPRFDFQKGFDLWFFDGRAKAGKQVDRALAFFKANQERDTYVFLHFMDPHLLYHAQKPFTHKFIDTVDPDMPRAFTKNQVKAWARDGSLTELRKDHIRGLYDGELGLTSAHVGRLIKALDALPGDTLVVFHSDHGEEFWEHGGFEHNHTLYEEVTRGLLWIRPPGGTQGGAVVSEQPATLADIAPTLYDYLGFEDLPPTDGISLRPFLEGRAPEPRDIGIAHLRHGTDRWGVVHDGKKYILHTGTGTEELYALPDEQKDLHQEQDLQPFRSALLGAHPGLKGGPGWRVTIQEPGAFTLKLPRAAVDAGVLDPDLHLRTRANLSWGEAPIQTKAQVGKVALSEDRKTLTFAPGTKPNGILWVIFDEEAPVDAVGLEITGTPVPYPPTNGYISASGGKIRIRPGWVIVPPAGEAERMQHTGAARTAEETCRLCQLGYIEGPSCEGC